MQQTYGDLKADLLAYTTYDADDFVAEFPAFIQASEERIWYFIQLPWFRKASLGQLTGGPYINLPDDFLAPASFAIIRSDGSYKYLLNKDVNYIRECYPNPNTLLEPECYALFDNDNLIVGPSPDQNYQCELNYFYRPASITAGADDGTSWLSLNAYNTLLYGALSESANFLKKNKGIDTMGDDYEQRFLVGVKGLQSLGESRDRKDTYRGGEKRTAEATG
jgi:hypothetical protein